MPRPDNWYQQFLEALEKAGCDVNNPVSALLLKTISNGRIKGFFEDESKEGAERLLSGKTDLTKLTPEQQDALYEQAVSGNLLYSPDPHPGNSKMFFSDKGVPKLTTEIDKANRFFYSDSVLNSINTYTDVVSKTFDVETFDGVHDAAALEMTVFPEIYEEPAAGNARIEQLKLHVQNKYSQIPLTPEQKKIFDTSMPPESLAKLKKEICGAQPGSRLIDMINGGLITAADGRPVEAGATALESYENLASAASSGEIFVMDLEKTKSTSLAFRTNGTVEKHEHQTVPVDPDFKEDVKNSLSAIAAEMAETKSKSPVYNELRQKMELIGQNLDKVKFKDEFESVITEAASLADKYYYDHVGASMKAAGLKRVDLAERIRTVRDQAFEGKKPSETTREKTDVMRKALAERYVKAYAIAAAKKSKDAAERERAKQIQTDTEAFNKAVADALKDKSFNYLYSGDSDESLERLNRAVKESPSKIVGEVMKEKKDPTPERIQRERYLRQVPPARTESYRKGEVSDAVYDDVARMVNSANAVLSKAHGDPKLEKLKEEVAIAKIRFDSGARYIDIRRMAAKLGQLSDEYFDSSLNKHIDGDKLEFVQAASRLRHMADAVNEDKMPSEAIPETNELNKEILASMVVRKSANEMMASKDPNVQVRGKAMVLDAPSFKTQIKKVLSNEDYEGLFAKPDKVKSLLNKEPDSALNTFVKARKAAANMKSKVKNGPENVPVKPAAKKPQVKKPAEVSKPSQVSVAPV